MPGSLDTSLVRCKFVNAINRWSCLSWGHHENSKDSVYAVRVFLRQKFEQIASSRRSCSLRRDNSSRNLVWAKDKKLPWHLTFGCDASVTWLCMRHSILRKERCYENDYKTKYADSHLSYWNIRNLWWWKHCHYLSTSRRRWESFK